MLIVASGFFFLAVLIQLFYFQVVFRHLALYDSNNLISHSCIQPVSVIIASRNEEKNLFDYLPFILEQEYPEYEVLVIDDGSTDGTCSLLTKLSLKYDHLKVIRLESNQGKKAALSKGIEAAMNELLVFIDADCKPASRSWLKRMATNFTKEKQIVIGFSPHSKSNGILNAMIRYDTNQTAIHYFSFALKGKPYMGVGRNLAYRKSLWLEHGGFGSHADLLSGDDDLFVISAATGSNCGIEIHPDAWTFSNAPSNLNAWFQQKRRHLTTGIRYPLNTIFWLWLYPCSTLVFYIVGLTLIFESAMVFPVLIFFGIRFLFQYVLLNNCYNRLGGKDLLLFSPLLEVFYIIFNFSAGFTNQFFQKSQWQ
jgi:cellulose synthase/poly-beta-1,6-N-acetylglucosamine synthase-like glycosyltransferase